MTAFCDGFSFSNRFVDISQLVKDHHTLLERVGLLRIASIILAMHWWSIPIQCVNEILENYCSLLSGRSSKIEPFNWNKFSYLITLLVRILWGFDTRVTYHIAGSSLSKLKTCTQKLRLLSIKELLVSMKELSR